MRGGDFLADGLDRLHDLARGLLAGVLERYVDLVRCSCALFRRSSQGLPDAHDKIVLGGFDVLAITAEVIAADLLFRQDGEKTVRS